MKSLVIDLKELLWKKRMTQRELLERIKELDPTGKGIREAGLSELVNNKMKRLPLETINMILTILEVDDPSEFFVIVDVKDGEEQ